MKYLITLLLIFCACLSSIGQNNELEAAKIKIREMIALDDSIGIERIEILELEPKFQQHSQEVADSVHFYHMPYFTLFFYAYMPNHQIDQLTFDLSDRGTFRVRKHLTSIEYVATEAEDIYRAELFLDSTLHISLKEWYKMKAVRSFEAEEASYHNICVSKPIKR